MSELTQEPTTQEIQKKSNQNDVKESKHITPDYQNNINRYFVACEDYVTQYRQSLERFQIDCIRSCKKIYNSAMTTEREIAKIYVDYSITEPTQQIIANYIDSATKLTQAQSTVLSKSFAMAGNNIGSLSLDSKPFAEMYRGITDLWNPSKSKNQ